MRYRTYADVIIASAANDDENNGDEEELDLLLRLPQAELNRLTPNLNK